MTTTTTTPEQRARQGFLQHIGEAPAVLVQAPGRVNLIGEHTDYNDGFVLPCAIDFRTAVAARPRSDGRVRVLALDQNGAWDEFPVDEAYQPRDDWSAYPRGFVAAWRAAGHALSGADLVITGDVPQGAGLSSSASLLVAIGQAFKALQGLDTLSGPAIALLAQKAENDYVGCHCGIMDQMVSACGEPDHAVLLDCRSLETVSVPLPPGLAVLILHSNVKRGLVGSAYNERRAQCEAAARFYGVPALRDLTEAQLGSAPPAGLDPVAWRRARHVVTEDTRTLAASDALRDGDLQKLGALMAASHASMRDDFEITVPPIDELVALVHGCLAGEGGVRMTGGGFGGCVVAVTTPARAQQAVERVLSAYRSPEGLQATPYLCHASAGAGVVTAG
ncbi:MAG TPA: galactokinase [Roseateles sp.]